MDAAAVRGYYTTIAPVYDVETSDRNDVPFWQTLVTSWKPRSVLECGCGTGRVTIPLALCVSAWEGWVAGMDIAPTMLRRARDRWRRDRGERSRATLSLAYGDFCRDTTGRLFDLIAFADDPLTHVADTTDLACAFRHVRDQLQPGGRLVIDATLLPPEARGQSSRIVVRNTREVPSDQGALKIEQIRVVEPRRASAHIVYRWRKDSATGSHGNSAGFTAYYHDVEELRDLFRVAGCRVEEEWADFHFRRFQSDAGMIVMTGTRQ